MKKAGKDIYNIEALGKLTGLNRRTIRYYIQRGVLQKPYGGGRGHYYTGEHVKRIRELQQLRKQGIPLEKMRELFASPSEASQSFEIFSAPLTGEEEIWHRVVIGDGIEISFKDGMLNEKGKGDILNHIKKILQRREKNNE